jgi:hypothetical protein
MSQLQLITVLPSWKILLKVLLANDKQTSNNSSYSDQNETIRRQTRRNPVTENVSTVASRSCSIDEASKNQESRDFLFAFAKNEA